MTIALFQELKEIRSRLMKSCSNCRVSWNILSYFFMEIRACEIPLSIFFYKFLISNPKYIMSSRSIYNGRKRKVTCIKHILYGPALCWVHVLFYKWRSY